MKLRKRYSMSMGPKKKHNAKKKATTPCYRRTHVNKLQTGPPRVKALVGETLADLTAPLSLYEKRRVEEKKIEGVWV